MVLAAFLLGTQFGSSGEGETAARSSDTDETEPAVADVDEEGPDIDRIAADICSGLRDPADVGVEIRAAEVGITDRRNLRLAIEDRCPDVAIAAPDPTYYEPTADDYELTVKTLEKKCFGSAGCNVTFRVELAYGGEAVDPTQRYELTYEILGGDDPQIRTMDLKGDTYSQREEDRIGTPSSDAELTAVVIDVSARS